MIFIRTVVFLFLPSSFNALISDEMLRSFCQSPIIHFPGGLEASARVGDEQCTQEVPEYSDDISQRHRICFKYAPFYLYSAEPTADKKRTKCVWGQKYQCRAGEKTIGHSCLTQTLHLTFAELQSYCKQQKRSVYSTGDRTESRWLLRLLHTEGTNVWVENDLSRSQPFLPANKEMGYSRSNYDYGIKYKQVSIVGSHDWELGIYMGMLIPTKEDERLVGFCSRPAIRAPSPPGTSDPIRFHNDSSRIYVPITGSLTAFLSKPFAFSKIKKQASALDLDDMAAHCKRESRDSFPLPPTEEILMKIKEYINHPVYIYANMHEPAEYINDCTKTKDRSSVMRALFKTRDENKKPKAIPKEFWDTGYPKAICSKHSPVAVVSNSYGKLQNFPSNARLPVICGTGVPPVLPLQQICQNPNTIPLPDGKCKCKDGFIDGSTVNPDYPPGRYCRAKKPCMDQQTTDLYFYILVDESTSINFKPGRWGQEFVNDNWKQYVVPFVREVIEQIQPGTAKRGGLIRFSSGVDDYLTNTWQPQTYLRAMQTQYRKGATYLGHALKKLNEHLRTIRFPWNRKYKLVTVIFTDGDPNDGRSTTMAVEQARSLKQFKNSQVIVFRVGEGTDRVSKDIASSNDDVIWTKEFSRIKEAIGDLMTRVCPTISPEELLEEN